MENQESNTNNSVLHIYSEFMLKIAKFEELVTKGSKLILGFHQGLDFLRQPLFEKISALVVDIVKSNQTEKLSSYLAAGGVQVNDATGNMSKLNLSYLGLMDHLIKGKCIVDELEGFVRTATTEAKADNGNLYLGRADKIYSEEMQVCDQKCDNADYGAAMAILCTMVKKDFRMQEEIVSSLSLKSSSIELESYSLMWSLRPFIDEDLMLSAWKLVR